MAIQEIFAKNVRNHRKQKGYSQEEFARICGVHRTYMWLIERGKTTVSIEVLERIKKELNITYDQLLN